MELVLCLLFRFIIIFLILSSFQYSFGVAQFVWHLNQSFSLNTSVSVGQELDISQTELLFFPFEPEYTSLQQKNATAIVYAYLCFISFSTSSSQNRSYTLSICLAAFQNGMFQDVTDVVWTANQGKPVTGEVLSLTLQSDGDLVLRGDGDEQPAWSSGTNSSVVGMELSVDDTHGVNLVLFDSNNYTVWQSKDHPTDTLTYGQSLPQGKKLVSWASSSDTTDGIYSLAVEPGGLALYASFPRSLPYRMWIHSSTCPNTVASLMNASCGNLTNIFFDYLGLECAVAVQESEFSWPLPADVCLLFADTTGSSLNATIFKLYWDGNVRAYTLQYSSSTVIQRVTFVDAFFQKQCDLPLPCGPYGVCKGTGSSPQCECPTNSSLFRALNSSDSTEGCVHVQPLVSNCALNNTTTFLNASTPLQMLRVEGLDYFSNAFSSPLSQLLTEKDCSEACLQNCSCLAAFWYDHALACFHVDQMGSLQGSRNQSYISYLKVNTTPISSPASSNTINRSIVAAAAVVSGLVALFLFSCLFCYIIVRRMRLHASEEIDDSEMAMLDSIPGLPTRFSYNELHLITNGFASKLGKGGFGAVYAGALLDGTKVAVKQLESLRQGEKEFRSEVAIMAGIHHYNLLRLLGFCAQGAHRLLVYEYMENGSLDQWLFSKSNGCDHDGGEKPPLSWDVRCKIALGAARGLAYLHEECRERILHLDIKPQNILLNEDFVAKVADFGLSRLMGRDESFVVTTMRGTPGYLAPEWLKEGSIDEKCDVFSFGMLLMEMVSGRKNLDHTVECKEKVYYPEWAYWKATQQGLIADELTNAKLESEEDRAQLMNMITTAFLCVVEKPEWRPSMAKVVQMLESSGPDHHHLAEQLPSLHQRLLFVLSNPSHGRREAPGITLQPDTTTSSSSNTTRLLSGKYFPESRRL